LLLPKHEQTVHTPWILLKRKPPGLHGTITSS
jgi:hypothetical protein